MIEKVTENPLVSVIVPTYNRADKISECLSSICNQTYSNFEIIIVDDGSTDNTEETIKQFTTTVCTKKNIQYFQTANSGPSAARNFGLTKANGELIIFFDSDDLMCASRVAKQVTSIITYKTDSCICGFTDSTSGAVYIPYINNKKGVIGSLLNWQLMGSTQCWLYKKKYLLEINGYDNLFTYYEDWLLTFKYLSCYPKVSIVNESLTLFKNDVREDRLSIAIDSEKRIPYIEKYYLYVIKYLATSKAEKKLLSFAIFSYVAQVTFYYIKHKDKERARKTYSTFFKTFNFLRNFKYLICQILFFYHLSKMSASYTFRQQNKVPAN